jgi:hypothetical protein
LCPLHNATASVITPASGSAAVSDPVVPSSAVLSFPSRYAPAATSDIVIERVLGGDGLMHVIMRQRR